MADDGAADNGRADRNPVTPANALFFNPKAYAVPSSRSHSLPNRRGWAVVGVFAGIVLGVWSLWLWAVGPGNAFPTVRAHWPVALTMLAGSFVAGASSEGGGAVAFPVFTKVLAVAPADARVFAWAIQAVGMTSASLAIVALRLPVAWGAIRWSSLGGGVGIVFASLAVAPQLPPAETRMLFTALQFGFAVALLLLLRRGATRRSAFEIEGGLPRALMLVAGFGGGLLSGLVGSGIDLLVFSVLVLLFRLSEKVATPTSVIIMAFNSVVGIAFFHVTSGPLSPTLHAMWLSAVPIVVVGAPLGAWVCSFLSRHMIARFLIGLILIEVVSTLCLVPLTIAVVTVGGVAGLGFVSLFVAMAKCRRFAPPVSSSPSSLRCAT